MLSTSFRINALNSPDIVAPHLPFSVRPFHTQTSAAWLMFGFRVGGLLFTVNVSVRYRDRRSRYTISGVGRVTGGKCPVVAAVTSPQFAIHRHCRTCRVGIRSVWRLPMNARHLPPDICPPLEITIADIRPLYSNRP